jgi:Chaperone of endosialidase
MNCRRRFFATSLATGTLLALTAYGQQPPDVVSSDRFGNTAAGDSALQSILTPLNGCNDEPNSCIGVWNTAIGANALSSTTNAQGNTATGYNSLTANTIGSGNTAYGLYSLDHNTSGANNTAGGVSALSGNVTGSNNTATGSGALFQNGSGNLNTADGLNALYSNATGASSTAVGATALFNSVSGQNNTSLGAGSEFANVTGSSNTAVGFNALGTNQGGSNNIAIGANAGYYIRGSLYNIDVGNVGNQQDVGLIRIGTSGQQTAAYIAGIASAHVTGSAVYITSAGQLGVLASSERYKTAVAPMGGSTEKLQQLRPVIFHLKTDPKGAVQYGLIAEEVAQVYPELVIRDEKGMIQGVRYEELAPMLLNEAQVQAAEIAQMKQQLRQLQASLGKLQCGDAFVARR